MTDTNNTDGAALLPVPCHFCKSGTIATTLYAAGLSWAQVECTNDKCDATGPCRDTEAKAVAAWNALAALSSPLPATQEDAERSGAGESHRCETPLEISKRLTDAKTAILRNAVERRRETSTPQRQEYDGEAVREAIEWLREGPDQLAEDMDTAIFQERLRQSKDARGWCGQPILNIVADALAARAALAHPAQATPSAVSGDAGEIPRVPTEAMCVMGDMHMQDCSHNAASVWAAMVSALPAHQGAGE